jgi:TfoX/Sxy family transcriptional regulator of competence genes
MVASDSFAEFLREQLAPLGRITMRRMFGKTGVFCDGVMFAMVTENTLYVRVDDQILSAPQLRQARLHHRPLVLARAGAPVR